MGVIVKGSKPTPASNIKDGTYAAAVTGIRQFSNTYGERIGFEFTITAGPYKGEKLMRSTAPQLTSKSKLAEVIQGVTGMELSAEVINEGFDLEELIDSACNILVINARSKNGAVYPNVERVFPC